ncbi:MAG: glucosaminidase domain-containing protein [Desulfuromonadales bacterium]
MLKRILKFSFPPMLALSLAPCPGFAENPSVETLTAASHRELSAFFATLDYNWESVTEGVPPIILQTLPSDLPEIRQPDEKKEIFFLTLLPMVLLANEEISRKRQDLEAIFAASDQGGLIAQEDRQRIATIGAEYAVEQDPLMDIEGRKRLLQRLDIIPPSLVLAQAANESGYGTSRFALLGNNLFGEWTFAAGTGIVPINRPDNQTYEVRRFPSLYASLKSYMKNLNTHWAYRSFREQRAQMRAAGIPLRGVDLASGIESYSIRGKDYVRDIRTIIRRNRLHLVSSATLRDAPATTGAGLLSSRLNQPSRRTPAQP